MAGAKVVSADTRHDEVQPRNIGALLKGADPDVTIYRDIVRQLEDVALSGKVQSGVKLPSERELATILGVGRNAVREGIKVLQARGLPQVRPGKGIFLTMPSNEVLTGALSLRMKFHQGTIEHLLETREMLELTIARLAAQRADAAQLTRLKRHLDEMEETLDQPVAFIEADREFHAALAQSVQNPMLEMFSQSTISLMDETRRYMILAVANGTERAQSHHRLIYRAVAARDAAKAAKAMAAHFVQIREDVEQTRCHIELLPD
jgi:GntR family transcriptional repressor for pyruvate dehydrogenase complex